MTPEEAIEVLKGEEAWRRGLKQFGRADAIGIGIEALKLNLEMRETYAHPELLKLPGETEK